MPVDRVRKQERQRQWAVQKREQLRAVRVESGDLLYCDDCGQWRKAGHSCLKVRAAFAEVLRNPGTEVVCAGCGRATVTHIPKNLLWRAIYCRECLMEHDHQRARRKAEAAGREYIPLPVRQEAAEERRERQKVVAEPMAEFWPYGATGWPMAEVSAVVPREIPDARRADICQELCLMILAGELEVKDAAVSWRRVARKAYGEWARSIDWRDEDGFALADRLRADE